MEIINLKVAKQKIFSDRQYLVSKTENVYQCVFEFNDDWNNYSLKYGVFKNCKDKIRVLLNEDKCLIPSEILANDGHIVIGVYGVNDDERYPTVYTAPIILKLGARDGSEPAPPTPSEWEQIITELSNIENSIGVLNESVDVLEEDVQELDESKVSKIEGYGLVSDEDVEQITINKTDIANIKKVIPVGATEQNQLITEDETNDLLENKVDKEAGKGLSDNNFTDTQKNIVDNVPGALEEKADEEDLSALDQIVQLIRQLIPNQATESNQLADKDFVNSSIATSTATFKGTYNSVQELPTEGVDDNDYANVIVTDAQGNTSYDRYTWNGTWTFNFRINTTSFTAAQKAALDSGITSTILQTITASITTLISDTSTIKALIPQSASSTNKLVDAQSLGTLLLDKASKQYVDDKVDILTSANNIFHFFIRNGNLFVESNDSTLDLYNFRIENGHLIADMEEI